MDELEEVDLVSPANDHLGDYAADKGDPYPATQEAQQRTTVMLPGDYHADPDQVRNDVGVFASDPWRQGTQTREVTPDAWHPFGRLLNDGVQGLKLVEKDPHRTRLVVYNHADGPIWLASTPSRQPGDGALLIPARDSNGRVHWRELKTTADVWLFTLTGFLGGGQPVHVQVIAERWGP